MALVDEATANLYGLVAREYWRRTTSRLWLGPVLRWRFVGPTPSRILVAPPDLRFADPQIATDIYYGRFPLAGQLVDTRGQSPFRIETARPGWHQALHGFRWLRHMRAARTSLAATNSRALVSDWMAVHGRRMGGQPWEPATTAKRIIAWLQHSPVVLQGADLAFYRAFLKSLSVQIRYLRSAAGQTADGEGRLRARMALAFAALCLPASNRALRTATRHLCEELDRQILPDGVHVSRSPLAVLELLADLLPLRQTYANQAEAPPAGLIGAVERLLPALRFFRHEDGSLARFNGMGATMHERIAAIMRYDDAVGAPLLHAPHAGFQRLSMGGTTVIADTGTPPASDVFDRAHAGCLSFEMSSDRQNFIVNAGIDAFQAEEFRMLARATAAHSTATIGDCSSARFSHSRRFSGIVGTPLVGGPRHVGCQRIDTADSQGFIARHDGYADRFGLIHERRVELSGEGGLICGCDRVLRRDGGPAFDDGRDGVTVRFHLHPDVQPHADRDGLLVLGGRDGRRWSFECAEVPPLLEESIFFAWLAGPRRTRQIVLAFSAARIPEVNWTLRRLPPAH